MSKDIDINKLAERLDTAAANAQATEQLSKEVTFDVDTAYAIQFASMRRRFERGQRMIGLKMGFTSKAKMEQMGVHDMIWGILTDDMLIDNKGTTPFKKYIHPRAEPELCFKVKKTIDKQLSQSDFAEYISGVAPAIEIIDSRYENFKFSLEDVIADNCSSTGLILGDFHPIDKSIADLKIDLLINNEVKQTGSTKAILGDPWESLIAATRLAAQYKWTIPAGSYIMAGAATSAEFIHPGQKISIKVEELGEVEFEVV